MPRETMDRLQRAVVAVVNARRAVQAKERALVASLDGTLKRLGYRVVPVERPAAGAGRASAPRRRGRR